jgi:PPOX class probable F420-dependent enzyme
MRTELRPKDLGDLLEQPILAILATRRQDDSILLSPVWFEWLDGGINVWVPPSASGKLRHVDRDPRVTIVVASQEWPYKGLEVRGEATLSTEAFQDVVRRTARRTFGDDGDAFADTFRDTNGTVIRIEGNVRCWDYTEEG